MAPAAVFPACSLDSLPGIGQGRTSRRFRDRWPCRD